jgi:hypothetical protein
MTLAERSERAGPSGVEQVSRREREIHSTNDPARRVSERHYALWLQSPRRSGISQQERRVEHASLACAQRGRALPSRPAQG